MASENSKFISNPRLYMRTVSIQSAFSQGSSGTSTFDDSKPHHLAYMDLNALDGGFFSSVTRATTSFSTTRTSSDSIQCLFVPYIFEGAVSSDNSKIGKVPLPSNGNPRFAFTGAMNGCSLVIARDNTSGVNYGVHYPNSGGPSSNYSYLGGYTIVKSIDHDGVNGYGVSRSGLEAEARRTGVVRWANAFCFFYYDNGQWNILAQAQYGTINTSSQISVSTNTTKGNVGLLES